jgi:hypothetical protein
MDLVAVYKATDELLANSVRDLLLQNGVAAMVRPASVVGYGFKDVTSIGIWGEVLVYDKDAERAEELIAGFLGTLGYLEEAGLDPEDLEAQAISAEVPEDGL